MFASGAGFTAGGKAVPMLKGIVFDIARAAMNDGPGIRTTVFFKGCPLRCPWCHNPESKRFQPEMVLDDTGKTVVYGREVTVDQVMDAIRQDIPFYRISGGGVTFSGGEPFSQPKFLEELCRQCQKEGISVCVDTSGYTPEETVRRILPYVDLVLLDYKQTGEWEHLKTVGVSLEPVLRTLTLLQQAEKPVWLRCPIVPGYQDNRAHLRAIAELEREFSCIRQVDLLFFHTLGRHKYRQLGLEDPTECLVPFSEEEKESFWRILNEYEAQMGMGISKSL